MNESDLILVFGASFSNHTGIYAGKPIMQVDSDPLQLGKFHPVEVPVWGDAEVTARLLLEGLPESLAPKTSAPSSVPAGRSGAPRRNPGPRTTAATASPPLQCSPR